MVKKDQPKAQENVHLSKGFVKDLVDNIQSGTHMIYVVTDDEVETVKHIKRTIASLNLFYKHTDTKKKLGYYEWNCVDGIQMGNLRECDNPRDEYYNYVMPGKKEKEDFVFDGKAEATNTKEALVALDMFSSRQPKAREHTYNAQIVVFKDIHPNLKDPRLVRKFKNIMLQNNDKETTVRKCFIIVSPIKYIPPELSNLMNIIEWKLPTHDDILDFLKYSAFITDVVDTVPQEIIDKKKKGAVRDVYSKKEVSEIISALAGLSFPEIENIIAVSNIRYLEIVPQFLMEQKKQLIIKNGLLEYYEPSVSMKEIGGMDILKDWISTRKKAFSEEAKKFGVETPRGVMLVGIQGCGKSHMAKAISHLLGLPLVRFDVAKVFSKTVGSSEENIRNVISLIEAVSPCVLMIDEIEKGLAGIQSSNQSDGGTTARVVGTLLSWLNDKTSPVFIVATANNIQQLPPELQRKGRFDEIFFVPLPEESERADIFKIHLEKRGRKASDFKVDLFAKLSDKFSGAECEEVIRAALIEAWDKGEELADQHIVEVIKTLIPLYHTCQEDIEYLYKWAGWDKEKNDGIRARFSSSARKEVSKAKGDNVIEFTKKS